MLDDFTYPKSLPKPATTYEANERLKHLVWLAAHGSASAVTRLKRLSTEKKRRAWLYSPQGIKIRAKATFKAST
jgi:hypothetical protein